MLNYAMEKQKLLNIANKLDDFNKRHIYYKTSRGPRFYKKPKQGGPFIVVDPSDDLPKIRNFDKCILNRGLIDKFEAKLPCDTCVDKICL